MITGVAFYPLGVDITSLTVPEGCGLVAEATPNAGYYFLHWSDNNTDATHTIMASSNMTLTATFSDTQGIDDVDTRDMSIYTMGGSIVVHGVEGLLMSVYDMMGREVIAATHSHTTAVMPNGVYLVKVGNHTPPTCFYRLKGHASWQRSHPSE